jgi:hypothetical protein
MTYKLRKKDRSTYKSTTMTNNHQHNYNCMDELLPYFFGDLFMLLSVMSIFAGTVLLLGPWRRPKTKACRTWKMLRVIHRSLKIHGWHDYMYIYVSMYCEHICSNGNKCLCIYICKYIYTHDIYIYIMCINIMWMVVHMCLIKQQKQKTEEPGKPVFGQDWGYRICTIPVAHPTQTPYV